MTHIQDRNFESHRSADYFLSGQVGLSGFSFAVTDRNGVCRVLKTPAYRRAILHYDDWAQELDALFHQEPLLQLPYGHSRWMFLSDRATLLPQELVQPGQLRRALEYVAELDELDEIHYRMLPGHGAACVFAVPSPPANIISKYRPGTQFLHQQVPLMRLAGALCAADRVVLHCTPGLADMVVFAGNRPVLSNSYRVNTFTDMLYNLLLVMQQLRLSFTETPLYYLGDVDGESRQLLGRYFAQVQPLYAPSEVLDRAAATTFHALLTLPQCE